MTSSKVLNIKGEKDITANSNTNRKKYRGRHFFKMKKLKLKQH